MKATSVLENGIKKTVDLKLIYKEILTTENSELHYFELSIRQV